MLITRNFGIKPFLMLFGAIILLATIGWHAAVFNHTHPGFMGGEGKIQAVFHNENKKWLVVALLVLALSTTLDSFRIGASSLSKNAAASPRHNFYVSRLYNFLHEYFSGGLLHPKLH